MKTILFLILIALLASFPKSLWPQMVPEKVQKSFAAKFPKAIDKGWERESSTIWEVDFQWNKQSFSASFSESGIWLQTEHEIDVMDLPDVVRNMIMQQYPGYEIKEAGRIETEDTIAFEIELENERLEKEITMDSQGQVLHVSDKEGPDDDD